MHRAVVLGLLTSGYVSLHPAAAYHYAERMGTADGLELPAHVGSAAWCIAVGEAMSTETATASTSSPTVFVTMTPTDDRAEEGFKDGDAPDTAADSPAGAMLRGEWPTSAPCGRPTSARWWRAARRRR